MATLSRGCKLSIVQHFSDVLSAQMWPTAEHTLTNEMRQGVEI